MTLRHNLKFISVFVTKTTYIVSLELEVRLCTRSPFQIDQQLRNINDSTSVSFPAFLLVVNRNIR